MTEQILTKIDTISGELLVDHCPHPIGEKLSIIGSDSLLAIAFISAIEEEWSIHIPDDYITLDFFNDCDYLVACICAQL